MRGPLLNLISSDAYAKAIHGALPHHRIVAGHLGLTQAAKLSVFNRFWLLGFPLTIMPGNS